MGKGGGSGGDKGTHPFLAAGKLLCLLCPHSNSSSWPQARSRLLIPALKNPLPCPLPSFAAPKPLNPPPLQDDEGGGVELEEELLAAACDMLPALASAAGPAAYAAVFAADHLPHLLAR